MGQKLATPSFEPMLTKEEIRFVKSWEAELATPTPVWRYLVRGVPVGLLIGLAIVGLLTSGWYERANMQMVKLNPYLLLISIVSITIFCAWVYQKFRRETLQQRYDELKAKTRAANFTEGKSL